MAQQQPAARKGIKKGFFEVKAPLTSAPIHLYGATAEEFNGRFVKLDLTRSLKGKSFELKLRVNHENGELKGEPVTLELAGSYIRKSIRKGTDYVEDSFAAECRDFNVRIKPFMLTRKKVSRAVRNALRTNARNFIESYIKARTAGEIFSELTANKLQRELSFKLKKIYPLALCEIRYFGIESEKAKKTEEKVASK